MQTKQKIEKEITITVCDICERRVSEWADNYVIGTVDGNNIDICINCLELAIKEYRKNRNA